MANVPKISDLKNKMLKALPRRGSGGTDLAIKSHGAEVAEW